MPSKIFISKFTDPYINLSIEDYLFRHVISSSNNNYCPSILFLYQNDPTVVIGRAQNPWLETNLPWIKENKINLIRRQSGGGTVYHDLGNLNYSFLALTPYYQVDQHLRILINALANLGLDAHANKRHDLYINGGGDSQDTTNKLSEYAKSIGYDLKCIGLPKTIDNDLPFTDFSPGFPSTAKYIAISTLEAGLDVVSMAPTSTKVFILEVMGRNAGWIAAASALASNDKSKPPHIILFPEVAFDCRKFLKKVDICVKKYGFCTIIAAEGIKNTEGVFLSMQNESGDSFGHNQLGGVSAKLASLIKDNLGYKYHFALADYLQRSARHIASKVDVDCAYNIGEQAVVRALSGKNAVMLTLNRFKAKSNDKTKWL